MQTARKDIQKKETRLKEGVERTTAKKLYKPAVDIIERKNDVVVIADMPGVDEKSVDITLEKDILTIYGKVEPEIPQNHRLSHSEYGVGDYERAFTISDEINREKIVATVKKFFGFLLK